MDIRLPCLIRVIPGFLVAAVVLVLLPGPLALAQAAAQEAHPGAGSDDDAVEATVQLLQARLAQGRGDLAAALRDYQRAWRYSPAGTPIPAEIVPLAFELKRNDEAARYAVLSAEHEPSDPALLRRLAMLLTGQRDWKRAAKLYELSLTLGPAEQQPDERPDLAALTVRLELGRLYFLTGEFGKSADSFAAVRDALKEDRPELTDVARKVLLGEADETYSLWAEAFLAAERHADAAELFRKSHEAKPDAALLAFQLARVEAAQGNPSAARRQLEEYFATRSTAGGPEPYELFVEQVQKHESDPAAARRTILSRFEALATRDPENLWLKVALAGQYLEASQFDKAEPLLLAAAAARPSGDAYRPLVELYRRQNKPDKLVALLAAIAAQTGSLDVLGEARQKLTADKPLVQRLIALARAKFRTRPEALIDGEQFAIGLVALEAKEFNAADELLAAAADADRERKQAVLHRWGLGMMLAEQYPRAAKVFQRIIDERAGNKQASEERPSQDDEATPYYYLAAALEMSGQHDAAIAAARKGAELKPDEPRMAARPAWILYHAEQHDAAREAYRQFIEKFDSRHDSAEVRSALREARLVLSTIELNRGDFEAAVERLEQVLDEFPEDVQASNDLGYLWADRGMHLERARRMIEHAVSADPNNAAYRDSLGWVLFRLGKHAEAAEELERAAAGTKDEPDGVILDHLGDAYDKAGRREESLAAWRRAEAVFQKEGDANRLEAVRKKLTDAPSP